jgi:hypothetical protein
MEELAIVYRATPADVPRVVGYLESHAVHPIVIDEVEKMGPYRGQTHQIRIAVPETQRDMAIRILARMERQDTLRLFPVIRKARTVVLLLIAALAVLAVVGLLDARGAWFAGIGLLLAAAGAVVLIRWAWRGESPASAARTNRFAGRIGRNDSPRVE